MFPFNIFNSNFYLYKQYLLFYNQMGNNDSQTSISLHNWEILETIEGLQILKHKKN